MIKKSIRKILSLAICILLLSSNLMYAEDNKLEAVKYADIAGNK
jgi:hypothetical protein